MSRKTAVFKDPLFLEHDPGHGHIEAPERLVAMYQALDLPENRDRFLFPGFAPASFAELALNHTPAHIERVAKTAGRQFCILDPDTHTSPGSYDAACRAAGAVIAGLKMMASGKADNAAALVRPPGHHAEQDHTSGFCLFNNIAVGAHYGLKHLGMERIFILDWDIHHGNGTQNAFYDTDQVLYCSTHQYPYFPGSGGLHEVGQGRGEGHTINVPLPGGQNDAAFARIMNELIVPVARRYKPDCIMVSAGFDTHVSDPLGTMAVSVNGFAYMTRVLTGLAAELCGNRLILVLEGGYNLQALKESTLACLDEMQGTSRLTTALLQDLQQASPALPPLDKALTIAKKYWTF